MILSNRYVVSIFLMLFSTVCMGQFTFNKVYNFAHPDTVFNSHIYCHIPDSTFFICAGNTQNDTSTLVSFISALDYSGHVLWKKILQFPGVYNQLQGNAPMIKLTHNRYVVSGCEVDTRTHKDTIWEYHPYLYFFNAHGDSIRYSKDTTAYNSIIPSAIAYTTDGYIIMAGIHFKAITYDSRFNTFNYDSSCLYIAKYDTLGKMIWQKNYYTTPRASVSDYTPFKAVTAKNGGVLVAGYGLIDSSLYSHFILKVDANGNILWNKNYLPNKYPTDQAIDIINASNGGYYFTTIRATINSYNAPPANNFLYYGRIDENGDSIWKKTFFYPPSEDYENNRLFESKNKNILFTGNMYYYYNHTSLVISDSTGKVISYIEHVYVPYKIDSGIDIQKISCISATPSHSILMTGVVRNFFKAWDTVGQVGWVLMTDSLGHLKNDTIKNDTDSIHQALLAYPNPSNNFTHIRYFVPGNTQQAILKITNMLEQAVNTITLPLKSNHFTWQHQDIAAGMYICQLYADGQLVGTTRVVIMH